MLSFILTLGLLNMLGGRGLFPYARVICRMTLMPLMIAWYSGFDFYISVISFVGMALWAAPGWGRYFSAFTGRYDPAEKEIGWIDRIGERVYPYDDLIDTNYKRGTLCMGLRGAYLYPMFLLLAFVNPVSLLSGAFCLSQGFCYAAGRLFPKQYAVMIAEGLTGILIGFLITFTL